MRSAIGVPVVLPSYTPERISTRSSSRRCVTWREVPGLRRSRSGWMSASESAIPGGQPSITQPIAGPCDSPKVVTVKSVPRVLPDMVFAVYCIRRFVNGSRGCSSAWLQVSAARVSLGEPGDMDSGIDLAAKVPHEKHAHPYRLGLRGEPHLFRTRPQGHPRFGPRGTLWRADQTAE